MPKAPIAKKRRLDIRGAIQQAEDFHRQGKLKEAESLYLAVLKLRPDHFNALHNLGILRVQQGSIEAAVKLIALALEQEPRSAVAHINLAIALARLNRYEQAIASYDNALAIEPNHPEVLNDRGIALHRLDRHEEAVASYDGALAVRRNHAEALNNRGNALQALSRHEEAIASYDRALEIKPDYADALNNRGNALQVLNRHEEAIASYDRALKIKPDYANALNSRGTALQVLNHHEEAVASYDGAVAIKPDYAEALYNRGTALARLRRYEAAIGSYDKVLALEPGHAQALNNRGTALAGLDRYDEAIASYGKVLALKPGDADTLNNLGNAFLALNRHEEAIASFDKVLAIQPDYEYAAGATAHSRAQICDWRNYDVTVKRLVDDVRFGKPVSFPFPFLSISQSPADQLTCATTFVRDKYPAIVPPLCKGNPCRHDKVRVAYLSADFRDHAVAYLTAGLFEQHDREKFETIAVSFGSDTQSEMRSRLISSFDRFIDVGNKSDGEVAGLMRESEVDIAIDLMGFTTNSRAGIFARRPAPIQVNYLGYPGTMGADYIDYIVADEFVIPKENHISFFERVVYLPDCYQVNDSKRRIAEHTPTRAGAGLPEQGFVFCSFNNSYKLTPQVFDIWMRLLRKVEHSVLWLVQGSAAVVSNLRREAQARGIDPARLVFAPRMKLEDYLARYRLAGLFLDTLPFNAGTTASDALWAGLPVVTCAGQAFVARMAGSLLRAVGLPELVTGTLDEYEALALKLATHPAMLRDLRETLARNRLTAPLFDTDRFRRHIESAYWTMWEIHQRGEAPRSFSVDPVDR